MSTPLVRYVSNRMAYSRFKAGRTIRGIKSAKASSLERSNEIKRLVIALRAEVAHAKNRVPANERPETEADAVKRFIYLWKSYREFQKLAARYGITGKADDKVTPRKLEEFFAASSKRFSPHTSAWLWNNFRQEFLRQKPKSSRKKMREFRSTEESLTILLPYQELFYAVFRRHGLKRHNLEDAVSTMMLRLAIKLNHFDTSKGVPIDKAIKISIRNLVQEYFRDRLGRTRTPIVLEPLTGEGSKFFVDLADFERGNINEWGEVLIKAAGKLPDNERKILYDIYHEGKTLAQIGKGMHLSESRVSKLHIKAIARLRELLEKYKK